MPYFTFKELDEEGLAQKDAEFMSSIYQTPQSGEAYLELEKFFSGMAPETIWKKYYYSYWRWYVLLTWLSLFRFSFDRMEIIVKTQIPMALLLDIDVLKELLVYLKGNAHLGIELDSFILKLKESFLNSEAVFGVRKGEVLNLSMVIKEAVLINDADTMQIAVFKGSLKDIFESNINEHTFVDSDIALSRLIDLIDFFEFVDDSNIHQILENFSLGFYSGVKGIVNPGKFQNVAPSEAPVTLPATVASATAKPAPQPQAVVPPKKEAKPRIEPQSIALNTEAAAPSTWDSGIGESKLVVPPTIRPKPTPAQTPVVEPQGQLATGQVKSQIESQFKKDADGNFIDIEGVMAKLNELAEKYNDPKIAEMYYFDEKENKFKWNI